MESSCSLCCCLHFLDRMWVFLFFLDVHIGTDASDSLLVWPTHLISILTQAAPPPWLEGHLAVVTAWRFTQEPSGRLPATQVTDGTLRQSLVSFIFDHNMIELASILWWEQWGVNMSHCQITGWRDGCSRFYSLHAWYRACGIIFWSFTNMAENQRGHSCHLPHMNTHLLRSHV